MSTTAAISNHYLLCRKFELKRLNRRNNRNTKSVFTDIENKYGFGAALGSVYFVCMCVCEKEKEGERVRKEARLNKVENGREKEGESLCKPQFPDRKQFLHNCMTCTATCKVIDFSWQHFTFSSLFYCHFQGAANQPDSFFPVQIP